MVIVFVAVRFSKDPGLQQAAEDFDVEELVAESGIEAFHVGVLPRASRFNEASLESTPGDPILHGMRNELRPVV